MSHTCWLFVCLENCLFRSIMHFKSNYLGVLVIVLISSYSCFIHWQMNAQIFSSVLLAVSSVCPLLLLLCRSFECDIPHLSVFASIACVLGDLLQKIFAYINILKWSLFCPRYFIISFLAFRSLVLFYWFLIFSRIRHLIWTYFHSFTEGYPVSQDHLLKRLPCL